jgi:hypothetical protein
MVERRGADLCGWIWFSARYPACMPAPEITVPDDEDRAGPVFSSFGIASVVLAILAVASVVLGAMVWSAHRGVVAERDYQSRVLATAAAWTAVLVNMKADNIDPSLQRLHDQTVGDLNADFEKSMMPYRDVVKTLQSNTTGQVESVSIESEHHNLDVVPGQRPATPPTLPPELAQRTDSVLVVATSVSEVQGGKPTTVRWNLRLGVSDVDGTLMISWLESLR